MPTLSTGMPAAPTTLPPLLRPAGRVAIAAARLRATYPYTAVVLALGLLIRAAVLPLARGHDFIARDLDTRATLDGFNIYAYHLPHYPGGPYAYFPLFLYLDVPFQWLALHTGLPFTILGKLPIVAGDVLTATLIARYLLRRGHGDGLAALGAALFFLNPLVLYNGAFYGRFDAMCVGLFLLALMAYRSQAPHGRRFPVVYALAVAMKTYPVFVLPWLLVRATGQRRRLATALAVVLGLISLPYLVADARMFFADIVLYDLHKAPGNLSWQVALLGILSTEQARLLSYLMLALFVAALFAFLKLDLYTYSAVAILLFLVLSKVMIEQYLLWPMPFLILVALDRRSWSSAALLAVLTAVGMAVNPYIHPFGEQPRLINAALALCILGYVLTRPRATPSEAATSARLATRAPWRGQREHGSLHGAVERHG